MDIVSLMMGAVIASVFWISVYPHGKLRRLKELESEIAGKGTGSTPIE